jgi:GDPmannose 4,6-dehydratase
MSKKVIISGISGQDGSFMVDYLLANTDYFIYGMVRRSASPNYQNFKHNLDNPRFKLVTADLSDGTSLDTLVREIQPDYFINFAAQSFVGASWQIPEQTFDIVAMGVLRCLEAIRKHAPKCRFYSAGSSEEMGDVQYSPQDINHPIRPRSPYGAAKAAARHIVKVYRESYGLYAIHSILYNHESERRGEEFVTQKIAKNVVKIARELVSKGNCEPLELGNIDSKRDWSYAPDFVEGVWLMLNQDSPKEFILSSGETHTVREFVEKAFDAVGITGAWKNSGSPQDEEFVTYLNGGELPNGDIILAKKVLVKINPKFYRPAEVDLLLGDSTPARTELGWQPKTSFNQLVEKMVKAQNEK